MSIDTTGLPQPAPDDTARYFAVDAPPEGAPSGGGYVELDDVSPIFFLPGLEFRPVLGEGLLVNFIRYDPGTVVPMHAHEEEQITFVIEGEFEFEVGGEARRIGPGTVVKIPPHVPHGARALDRPCVQVDAFAPPRKVLVEAIAAQSAGPS
jgi:quercetin dioxygenase-like cupin family protein